MEPRYTVDENEIVFEVLDQEVMVVNLDTGYYYALEGAASDIWQAIAAGATASETTGALLARYAASRPEVAEAVAQFLAELLQESLLIPAPPGAAAPSLAASAAGS